MKKNILIAAVAALVLSLTACQKDNVNPENENGGQVQTQARVKSTADLHNTNWTYSVTTTELINNLLGTNYPCTDSASEETYEVGLEFDGTYVQAYAASPDFEGKLSLPCANANGRTRVTLPGKDLTHYTLVVLEKEPAK